MPRVSTRRLTTPAGQHPPANAGATTAPIRWPTCYDPARKSSKRRATMKTRTAGLIVLCGFLMVGAGLEAHHAVAGVYDLNKEVVLEGRLKKLNFTNPHASIQLTVPNKKNGKADGTFT